LKTFMEKFSVVEAFPPATGAGASNGDYITVKGGGVLVLVHLLQANAATTAITIEQATAVAGTGSKPIAKNIPVFLVADAATSDAPVRQADAVSYTTGATLTHKIVAFEIKPEDLDVAGGFTAICVKAGISNVANLISSVYIVGGRRYSGSSMVTDF
jgi:hypothetical protein